MNDQRADAVSGIFSSIFDLGIARHGFVPYVRDYEIVAGDHRGDSRWLFNHCVLAELATTLSTDLWVKSWDDYLTTREAMNDPQEAFVWAVGADAYPGPTYIADSRDAAKWSLSLGRRMHEVMLNTNVYRLRLVFHRVLVEWGDGLIGQASDQGQ
jgi:hypothetical protein